MWASPQMAMPVARIHCRSPQQQHTKKSISQLTDVHTSISRWISNSSLCPPHFTRNRSETTSHPRPAHTHRKRSVAEFRRCRWGWPCAVRLTEFFCVVVCGTGRPGTHEINASWWPCEYDRIIFHVGIPQLNNWRCGCSTNENNR